MGPRLFASHLYELPVSTLSVLGYTYEFIIDQVPLRLSTLTSFIIETGKRSSTKNKRMSCLWLNSWNSLSTEQQLIVEISLVEKIMIEKDVDEERMMRPDNSISSTRC